MMHRAGKWSLLVLAALAAVVSFAAPASAASGREQAALSVPGAVLPGGTISFAGSFCEIREANAVTSAIVTITVPGGTDIVRSLTRGSAVPTVTGFVKIPLTGSVTAPTTESGYTVTLVCALDTGPNVSTSSTVDVEGTAPTTASTTTTTTTTSTTTTTTTTTTTALATTTTVLPTTTQAPGAGVESATATTSPSQSGAAELARTGRASQPLLALGTALLVGGLLISGAARRRETR